MAVVIGLMMAGFGVGGVYLLFHFIRELARRLARLPYLERVEGTVTEVKSKVVPLGNQRDSGRVTVYFPVIAFQRHGKTQTFTSEFEDSNAARYVIGQKIGVRYDPTGAIPPMVDSWSSLWLAPAMGVVAGLLFLGGAALVYVAFGRRVFGG